MTAEGIPRTMRAVRLHAPGGLDGLAVEEIAVEQPADGDALVRVHAAAITRDELEWPVDRLPAIPSYEMSGVVAAVGAGVTGVAPGDEVYGLTGFDRDGAACEYALVPAGVLAPRPRALDGVEAAALPLAGLSAWQGLVEHGRLQRGERVLITGAAGGVGHLAVQLAHRRGAHVVGVASGEGATAARGFGADEVVDRAARFDEIVAPVDVVFDTVGGDVLARAASVLGDGGRLVSVAEGLPDGSATYFVVEPRRGELVELTRLVEEGALRPAVDSVFALSDARAAFERSLRPGKRGKVVISVRP
jgi:NADPH:quinone reductase-like Zn-dependent oxidoreductase